MAATKRSLVGEIGATAVQLLLPVLLLLLAMVLPARRAEGAPLPDSAGHVEMIHGLAYGNIPYGSVSGDLARTVLPAGHVPGSGSPAATAPLLLLIQPLLAGQEHQVLGERR